MAARNYGWVYSRLQESSTKSGIIAVLSAIAGGLTGTLDPATAVAIGLTGVTAVITKDAGSPDHPAQQA